MSMYTNQKMFCTICGQEYAWNCNLGFSKTRTCNIDCHREFEWRSILSMMGKEYYLSSKVGLDFGNVIKVIGGPMMDGFMDALKKLHEVFRHDIYIISRVNNDEGSRLALKFLRENGIIDCEGQMIEPRHIHFCLKREEKGPIAKKLGLTHFVDDRTECLHHMTSVQNRFALNPSQRQLLEFPPNGCTVVKDWVELLPKILETRKK